MDWDWSSTVDLAIGVVDNTVVVAFLNPFVNDASRPGIDHLGAKNSLLVVESAFTTDVTPSLGEEDWKVVSNSHGLKASISGILVCSGTAPLVGVETVEIDSLVWFTTGKVILEHRAKFGDLGRDDRLALDLEIFGEGETRCQEKNQICLRKRIICILSYSHRRRSIR